MLCTITPMISQAKLLKWVFKKLLQRICLSFPHSSYRKALSNAALTHTQMHLSDSIVCIFHSQWTWQLQDLSLHSRIWSMLFFSFITSRCIRAFCNCNLPEWWYFTVHNAALMHRPADWVSAGSAAVTFKLLQTFADWNYILRASSLWGMPHSPPVKNVIRSRKSSVILCGCSFLLCVPLLSGRGTSAWAEFPYFPCTLRVSSRIM